MQSNILYRNKLSKQMKTYRNKSSRKVAAGRGRSLLDQESPNKIMDAEDVRGRSAEDSVYQKKCRPQNMLAEHARGTCSEENATKTSRRTCSRQNTLYLSIGLFSSLSKAQRKIRGGQPRKTTYFFFRLNYCALYYNII